ncbi:MAG: hypothetical protein N3E40_00960 [Dehalococcoidia bacterium]|nr:hypothetical protein [Dehalococcoidia bacterium]
MQVVYHESPAHYDNFIKLVIGSVYVMLVLSGVGVYVDMGLEGLLVLLLAALLLTLILYLVMPRKYQVLDDRVVVVLGPLLSFNIWFSTIREVTQSWGVLLSLNFVTSVSPRYVVCILRHRGLAVAITPSDPQAFIAALERAISLWKRTGS